MLNNQKGILKKAERNEDAVELCNEKIRVSRDSLLALVNKNTDVLDYVNQDWVLENSQSYYEIALEAVKQNGNALWYVHEAWVFENSEKYYEIALVAVNQYGNALNDVNNAWALENSDQYYEIALVSVKQDGFTLKYINQNWIEKNIEKYEKIALAAVNQNGLAFRYAGDVFCNNIKMAISLLINLDREYFDNNSIMILIINDTIASMVSITCRLRNDILIYAYMLNNKNVSNNFKHVLFYFFIENFEETSFNNFTLSLYKNILECYLLLSNGYKKKFLEHQLLKNLSDDDSKQLHMFFSVADPSVNIQLAKLLKNDDNHIIKNYLTKNTYNFKCIKNFNIYSHLLPNNLFVVNYDKIIKKINENNINILKNDDLMRLVLCYFTIEDLLALSNDKLKAKLEGKSLNIDLEFHGPEGYISTGMQALVDAIKSNKGSLSNTGKYKYDTCSTIYNLVDIDPSLYKKTIELIE